MLVTPVPGQTREGVLAALRHVENGATAPRTSHGAQLRIGEYLDWATGAAEHLRYFVSAADVALLVLTPGYDRLLNAMGMPGDDVRTQRVLNGMLRLEEQQRAAALSAAITALAEQEARWNVPGQLVMPDSSFYIKHEDKLEEADFAALLDDTIVPVHVLVPIAVVDELDRLKESGQERPRWRAGYTVAVIDRVLKDPRARGVLRAAGQSLPRGPVTLEIVFDPPGHVRQQNTDDELIDRAVAVQVLSARRVTLVTYDTGQSTRGRVAGLEVIKLTKELGPEPDPDGTGRKPKAAARPKPASS